MQLEEFPWFVNIIGEVIGAAFVMGTVALYGWFLSEPVPGWAYFMAALLGIVLWSRPTVKDINRKIRGR